MRVKLKSCGVGKRMLTEEQSQQSTDSQQMMNLCVPTYFNTARTEAAHLHGKCTVGEISQDTA